MKLFYDGFKCGAVSLLLGVGLLGLYGCVSIRTPLVPSVTSDSNVTTLQNEGGVVLDRYSGRSLFLIKKEGRYSKTFNWSPVFYNTEKNWLYLGDESIKNWKLVSVFPESGSESSASAHLEKAFIAVNRKICCWIDRRTAEKYPYDFAVFLSMNSDGTGQEEIDRDKFYALYMERIPSVYVFMKELTQTLASGEYTRAENMRLKRIDEIKNVLKFVDSPELLNTEVRYQHDMLVKEQARLENIVGLSDPALCQLREKYIAAINNDKYDDATKIFDLIERMEKKYKPAPIQDVPQTVQVVQGEQPQLPQKIIVEHQEAPSVGKQMRALSTMAVGLDGGITPKAQNAWMGLFGLGDFIDASDKN